MASKKSVQTGKGPWPPALRKRVTAVRDGGSVPAEFYYDATGAWERVGGGESMPATLSVAGEVQRAVKHSFVGWNDRTGRCFTDEGWNPLVGLWVAKGGWDLVFDVVMPRAERPWDSGLAVGGMDRSAVWYAVRRYLHAATPEAFAQARTRVESVMNAVPPTVRPRGTYPDTAAWQVDFDRAQGFAHARSHIAFAFDRESGWADQLLRQLVAGDETIADLAMLLAVTRDAELAAAAITKWGGLSDVYYVYDMVESMGARAIPVLDLLRPNGAPDKKRVAEARAVAAALAADPASA